MGRALSTPRPSLDVRDVARSVMLLGAIVGFALVGAAVVVLRPELLRLLGYLVVSFALIALILARPRAGVLVTCAFLVLLAFLRRVLIAEAGWTSFDPLLLVGPTVAAVLVVQQFVLRRQPLAPDRLSLLVLAVLVITILEVPNPAGGGIVAGLAGFLFVGIPLLWFFIGRALATEHLCRRLLELTLCAGIGVALYGLCQTELGFPGWDQDWLAVNGYNSLNVGDQVRAFGTFASSAEYALTLGSALAIAAAFVLHGRTAWVLAVPPLAVALFLSSGRSALITAFLAVVVVAALRTRRAATAATIVVLAVGGAYAGLTLFGDTLNRSANNSGSSLVTHQVGGLTDPLNPRSSTLILHGELVYEGIVSAASDHPLGRGTGASNSAGGLGSTSEDSKSTEVDLSNNFVNLGLLGGVLYLAVFGLTLFTAGRAYFAGSDVVLGVIGLLIVGAGQWLTGGHYALSPITWLLIGMVAAIAHHQSRTGASRSNTEGHA